MSAAKIKRLIKLLMPTLLAFNFLIYFDYYVLPGNIRQITAVEKYTDYKGHFYIKDIYGKAKNVDYETYLVCQPYDDIFVKESFIFRYIQSFIIIKHDFHSTYDISAINMSLFFITAIFLLWFLLKKFHEYLYYIFFIPYIVLNLFIWGYLFQYKY